MNKLPRRPNKFYKDAEFMSSPEARSLRILSEYLGPLSRFHREKIKDTIVFFGSARAVPRAQAEAEYQALLQQSETNPLAITQEVLSQAQTRIVMSQYYEEAVELSRMLTEWSMSLGRKARRFVVCSGGGPGIMEAANRGARLAGGKTIGLNNSLPFEQAPNPYVSEGLSLDFHYFFTRKYWFAYLAKALIVFPGGFGTLDEMMEVLTLIQTAKISKKMVVLLYGSQYWNEVLNFNALVRWGTISAADLKLFEFADTPQQAFTVVRSGLERYYLSEYLDQEANTKKQADSESPMRPFLG
ncbi:MAG: TIGR00730 family Rossman fold protein, partial [Pyrinomonadaceae bacterium]